MAHEAKIVGMNHRDWQCNFCSRVNTKGRHITCQGCGSKYVPCANHAISVKRDDKVPWTDMAIQELKREWEPKIRAIRAGKLRLSDVQ